MSDNRLTGGCQCGAVRCLLEQQPQNVNVCHCRVCQKPVGGRFAVICPVPRPAFRVTRGAVGCFMSSDVARRGFCRNCGTPLLFEYPEADDLGVLVGTLDQPDRVPPVVQHGNESRVRWFRQLTGLPGDEATYADHPAMRLRIGSTNHQHPDHDTKVWFTHGAAS
jgi:hypothetical protein